MAKARGHACAARDVGHAPFLFPERRDAQDSQGCSAMNGVF